MNQRRYSDDPLAELARLIGQEDPFANFAERPSVVQVPSLEVRKARRRMFERYLEPLFPWDHLQDIKNEYSRDHRKPRSRS